MDTTTTTVCNPFDLPELRFQLSRFLAPKDVLSCALVSKAWTYEFVSAIWRKVDLSVHPRFAELPTNVITKQGHHIRVVNNARALEEDSALAYSNINKLGFLHIETAGSTWQYMRAYEIIARNITSLHALDVSAMYISPNKLRFSNYRVSTWAFATSSSALQARPSSILETLDLRNLWLTYDDLATILEASPRLSKLRLIHTDVVGTSTRFFQHPGVTLLSTSLNSIFPDIPTSLPSLLSFFPNLTTLHTWHQDSSAMAPSARIKKDFERYCRLLKQFKLEESSDDIIVEFFTNIVSNVTRITFQESRMTPETVAAIVLHQASMEKVAQFYPHRFDYEKEEVPQLRDNKVVSGEMMQDIPRRCSQLQRLNLHQHEMDMDIVELGEWV
ncbi:hypothetical protein BGX24_011332, partial [Mortierella sp. AD032]